MQHNLSIFYKEVKTNKTQICKKEINKNKRKTYTNKKNNVLLYEHSST